VIIAPENKRRWPAEIASTLNASFGDKQGLEDQHALNGAALFVAHSLRAQAQLSHREDADTLIPITFGAQMSVPQTDVDMVQTLQAKNPMAVAFSAKDYGGDASEELSPTLRSGSHSGSHANGGVMPAVAFGLAQITSAANRSRAEPGLPASTISKASRMHVAQPMAVRRLTPRECERLQGFKDDYTLVPHRGKPAADGPRYKALGNSMAVPVMAWIGQRIAQVEAMTREKAEAA
jgi:DNA (cytosine-5)-methyltransferase 1